MDCTANTSIVNVNPGIKRTPAHTIPNNHGNPHPKIKLLTTWGSFERDKGRLRRDEWNS